jgi:hypothetical protein
MTKHKLKAATTQADKPVARAPKPQPPVPLDERSPPQPRPADLLMSLTPDAGAAPQARATHSLQRAVGNGRLSRLAGAEAQTTASPSGSVQRQPPEEQAIAAPVPPEQRDNQQPGRAPAGPTCTTGPGIQAPDVETLKQRLVAYGVLLPSATSTGFANILYRQVTSGSRIGNEYLQFLLSRAYPTNDFCIVYQDRGWNATFQDILRFYHMRTPRHHATQGVRQAVESYARQHLFIFDESLLYPGGQRDPFAGPLTPRTLQRRPRGAVLNGEAPEGALLLLATDDYLTSLTLTAATVGATTPASVTSGSTTAEDVIAWGTAAQERTIGDPNRFDSLIVHWVNHYNEMYMPVKLPLSSGL